jgi:hypothetical protein
MADAPVTKKDLDALQKNLQKQLDDLRKWAKDEDDARVADAKKSIDEINKVVDQINKAIGVIQKALDELYKRTS